MSPGWAGTLDGAAVIDIQAGTETPRGSQIAPLNPSTHPSTMTVAMGDRLRIVGRQFVYLKTSCRPSAAFSPVLKASPRRCITNRESI